MLAACADPAVPAERSATVAAAPAEPAAAPEAASTVPYRLDAPDAVFELDADLDEISGLTVLSTGSLGAVQDEEGVLYEIDGTTGRRLRTERFRKDGDYEGVEATPDAIWVLKSNGTLYEVRRSEADPRQVESESYATDLRGRNDTEGLGYDADGNRLLVALKEDPGDGLGDVRAVYAFDLATKTLGAAPLFTLDRATIDAEGAPFKPSALAVRPGTDEAYVLSSVKKALLVVGLDGTIRAAVSLPASLFRQPEGIAFASDGTLFISNEGAGAAATLLRFSAR